MAVNNKIFTNVSGFGGGQSRKRINREYMLSSDIANELNAYRDTFFAVPAGSETLEQIYADKDDKIEKGDKNTAAVGARSIFNRVHAVGIGNIDTAGKDGEEGDGLVYASEVRLNNNVPLMDSRANREKLRQMGGCSIRELVQRSQAGYFGTAVYSYSDFMYCKHLGKVPNTYLITLRRFPIPVGDNMLPQGKTTVRSQMIAGQTAVPTGTMVTWLGVSGNDPKNILSYEYNMSFTEKQAGWQDIQKAGGGESGPLNSLEALVNPKTRAAMEQGISNPACDPATIVGSLWSGGSKYVSNGAYTPEPFWDTNKVHGPVDRVKSNYQRGEDGLQWKQSFDIVFEYELKSYNGINPRQAMLDLIGNILTTTYVTGGFWKGGYKPLGITQSSAFTNAKIFSASGGFSNFMSALSSDLGKAMSSFSEQFSLSKVLNAIGGFIMGAILNKMGRPARYRYPQLLSDAPVGFWHLTIGNPNHPIMSMGNMILKNTKIEHSGPLGLDDFPTNLKVTCSFDRGKPRDQLYTESLYMTGNDRIYIPMNEKYDEMYKGSKFIGSGSSSSTSVASALTDVTGGSSDALKLGKEKTNKEVADDKSSKTNASWMLKFFGIGEDDKINTASMEVFKGSAPKETSEEKAANTTTTTTTDNTDN